MFPEAINTTNMKKVSELWEEEKKYRWWIIGFAISLVILFLLNLIFLVLVYVNKDSLITFFKGLPESSQLKAESFFNNLALSSVFYTSALLFCSISFIYSIYISYKIKSFEKLNSFASIWLGIQTFFGFYSLFSFIMTFNNGETFFGNTFMIINFVLPILSIPVWLLLARQVRKIKRSFFIAKRQEEISAFYQANQGQMGNNGFQSPFGFPFQQQAQQGPIDVNQVVDEHFEVKQDPKYSKLEKMTIEQLRKIADKLSVSGIEEMSKPELIKTILAVTQSLDIDNDDQKDNSESHNSVDIDPKNS
ncbi:MAG: Rho termination factor N-terminal domain-containing protein [Metamycoplasmataceae bacterium]